ncbi:hypothetical protein D047_1514B, partial [Vibrio parahaemolyticus VPTS-2010_2]
SAGIANRVGAWFYKTKLVFVINLLHIRNHVGCCNWCGFPVFASKWPHVLFCYAAFI